MSPYEILQPGGSIEYSNPEPGATWLRRLADAYPSLAWLNPEPERSWDYRQTIGIVRQLIGEKMFPLTLDGMTRAITHLSRKN